MITPQQEPTQASLLSPWLHGASLQCVLPLSMRQKQIPTCIIQSDPKLTPKHSWSTRASTQITSSWLSTRALLSASTATPMISICPKHCPKTPTTASGKQWNKQLIYSIAKHNGVWCGVASSSCCASRLCLSLTPHTHTHAQTHSCAKLDTVWGLEFMTPLIYSLLLLLALVAAHRGTSACRDGLMRTLHHFEIHYKITYCKQAEIKQINKTNGKK